MATEIRARNSLILDHLRQQDAVPQIAVREQSNQFRRPFSVAQRVTPAITGPSFPVASPQRGGQASFAGLALPPLSVRSKVNVSPIEAKLDRIIELLAATQVDKQSQIGLGGYTLRFTKWDVNTAAPTQVVCGDANRHGLFVWERASQLNCFLDLRPDFGLDSGVLINPTNYLSLTLQKDGPIVHFPWWGLGPAGSRLDVWEMYPVHNP